VHILVVHLLQPPHDAPRAVLRARLLAAGLRHLGAPAHALDTLRHETLGRPRLAAPLELSLSYCEGHALCALSAQGAVGVDVERIEAAPPGRTDLYLSAAERRACAGDPRSLLALWTQKEAVAKAAGIGGLRRLDQVRLQDSRAVVGAEVWHLLRLDVGADALAHLACREPSPSIERLRLDAKTLL
jgi:4'-phosphopantetheinyl transferase